MSLDMCWWRSWRHFKERGSNTKKMTENLREF